jgi:hypothetical protein
MNLHILNILLRVNNSVGPGTVYGSTAGATVELELISITWFLFLHVEGGSYNVRYISW